MLSPVADQPSPPARRFGPPSTDRQSAEAATSTPLSQKQPRYRPSSLALGPAALDFGRVIAPNDAASGRLWTIVFEEIAGSDALEMGERGGAIPFVCREWRRLAELHFSVFAFPLGPAAALSTMLATVGELEPDLTAPESNPRRGAEAVWFYTGKITHTRGSRAGPASFCFAGSHQKPSALPRSSFWRRHQ